MHKKTFNAVFKYGFNSTPTENYISWKVMRVNYYESITIKTYKIQLAKEINERIKKKLKYFIENNTKLNF